jgi:hypothetical protein
MSLSAVRGAIGIAIQPAMGTTITDDAAYIYLPTLNANLMGEQIAQPLPPEVGGSYISRGSYKAAVRGRGEIALIPRVNTIGYLLRSAFNGEAVTANAATGLDANNVQVNRHLHRFTARDNAAPIWLSARRYVANALAEQITDCRVGMFRLEVAASNVANAAIQMLGRDTHEIPPADVYVPDGPVFLTAHAQVLSEGVEFIVDRMTIEIGLQLTDNEFRVGSYYLDDITALQRAVTVTCDVRVKSRDLWSKVYRYGGAAPAAGAIGSWSPIIYRAGMSLKLFSNAPVTGTAPPQYLEIAMPALDFLTLPVQMAGAELVRAQLQTMVTLDDDNWAGHDAAIQPISVDLMDDRATPYA